MNGCKKVEKSATLVHLQWFAFFMKPFINIWLELCICLVMTDNLCNEKSAGHQSDKSGWVLLLGVGDSQERGQRGRLPRAVSGGRVMS